MNSVTGRAKSEGSSCFYCAFGEADLTSRGEFKLRELVRVYQPYINMSLLWMYSSSGCLSNVFITLLESRKTCTPVES